MCFHLNKNPIGLFPQFRLHKRGMHYEEQIQVYNQTQDHGQGHRSSQSIRLFFGIMGVSIRESGVIFSIIFLNLVKVWENLFYLKLLVLINID